MKKILYIVLALGLLYIVLCLFGPSHVKVERSIEISAPSGFIKEKLLDLKFFQEKWSPWTELDPAMKVEFIGESGKKGNSMCWEGNDKVGKGCLVFERANADSIIQTLSFDEMGESKAYYIVNAKGESSEVIWGLTFDIGFFGRAPMLFMNMDKMLGADYEKGLLNLKNVMAAEKTDIKASYDIMETTWEERIYIGKKGTFKTVELPVFFANTFPKLADELMKTKTEIKSMPSAIYFSYDKDKMTAECAAVFTISDNKKKMDNWERFSIPAGKVLLIDYYGAYEKLSSAHYAMEAYLNQKGLEQKMVIEEYLTDPMQEKDTTKWLTKIYYVLK